ncbi:mitochondrial Complex V (CV) ATP synthase Fo complex assembly factor Atp10 [Andalucia godoyi]|uniref:Mitochondrial Complex V (CV) ATP synthase Fo complex assembly factor Atp10 n=1 Tax=Andalucia godoyi TaxID=505711 RepID=A0A8K0F1Z0_ANDGO|nr:mitochondrial Complex V (CV) ATP synthase Fo complex assembly factor Atp10 [Andalucia godoyi]|eukprot:ANDGO_00760.mRNA.1 mitochondrial Complex V (CV) ATP synthase Fo complex assembly factor Atp10
MFASRFAGSGVRGCVHSCASSRLALCSKPFVRWFSFRDFFTKEAKEARTARIKKEVSKSYFADMKAVRQDGGKQALPRFRSLIPSPQSRAFPAIMAVNLLDENIDVSSQLTGRVSLVLLGFRAFATPMIQQWQQLVQTQLLPVHPTLQVLELSVVESALFRSFLRSSILSGMRKSTPEERQRNVLVLFSASADFREQLGIENLLTAYALLVDEHGAVRWMASGAPDVEDQGILKECVAQLAIQSKQHQ